MNHVESGQTHAFKSPTTRPQREINDDEGSAVFYSRASTAGAWLKFYRAPRNCPAPFARRSVRQRPGRRRIERRHATLPRIDDGLVSPAMAARPARSAGHMAQSDVERIALPCCEARSTVNGAELQPHSHKRRGAPASRQTPLDAGSVYPFTHTTCFNVCTTSTRSRCASITASMSL